MLTTNRFRIATLFIAGAAIAACSSSEPKVDDAHAGHDMNKHAMEKATPEAGAEAAKPAVASVVAIKVTDAGYDPVEVPAKTGTEITLSFTRVTESTCGEEVVFPDFDIKKTLPYNETVEIKITPKQAGRLAFTCGMGMMKGAVVVTD